MTSAFRIFLGLAFISLILLSKEVIAQEKHVNLSELLDKATAFLLKQDNDLLTQGYYFVEISRDDGRVTKKNEECYQIWLAKADPAIPYYAGLAISSSGKLWEISPPITLKRFLFTDPKPKILLKEALTLAAKFADNNHLFQARDHFNTAYLITRKDGVQYWHILGSDVSLFVLMDGKVQETGDM